MQKISQRFVLRLLVSTLISSLSHHIVTRIKYMEMNIEMNSIVIRHLLCCSPAKGQANGQIDFQKETSEKNPIFEVNVVSFCKSLLVSFLLARK